MPGSRPSVRPRPRLAPAVVIVLVATGASAGTLQQVLEDSQRAAAFISRGLWAHVVEAAGGTAERAVGTAAPTADVPFAAVGGALLVISAILWLAGAGLIAWRARQPLTASLAAWGVRGWVWWLLPVAWETAWNIASLIESVWTMRLLIGVAPFCFAMAMAGWLATLFLLSFRPRAAETLDAAAARPHGIPAFIWIAAAASTLVWTAMNWQLYFALNLPHGDSAMYEEHLWNLLHGKGFRSYLDQGLFLGEHIQVIHVLLVPLYLLWPSHLLLELCQSAALASGAIATYLLARRHTRSVRAACCLAATYLLYFPLHFLDISIDLKTFRPMSFAVPLVLFALDQLERGRWKTMLVLLAIALSAKEDLAIVIAPLGVWIAFEAWRARRRSAPGAPAAASPMGAPMADAAPRPAGFFTGRRGAVLGLALAVFATAYLAAVVGWAIPAFRSGETVHYSRYFQTFGETPGEIVRTMLTEPARVARAFLTLDTLLYAAAMVVPLGFLPVWSPGRLAVGLPLFFVLCLNEIGRAPHFHFHAPLVPVVIWAAAAGLGNLGRWRASRRTEFHSVRTSEASAHDSSQARSVAARAAELERSGTPSCGTAAVLTTRFAGHFAWTSALAAGLFFSLGPLGLTFWDPNSGAYWRKLYVPGERAARFARIETLIPRNARVASTDFVHPRFTHHERSYDYSDYPRAVNDNQPGAPPDTDYIVIDKQDRYRVLMPPEKQIRGPDDLPEYRAAPERWDVLVNDEYFLVLQRQAAAE